MFTTNHVHFNKINSLHLNNKSVDLIDKWGWFRKHRRQNQSKWTPVGLFARGRYDSFFGPMQKYTEQEFLETKIKTRKKLKPKRKEVLQNGLLGRCWMGKLWMGTSFGIPQFPFDFDGKIFGNPQKWLTRESQ